MWKHELCWRLIGLQGLLWRLKGIWWLVGLLIDIGQLNGLLGWRLSRWVQLWILWGWIRRHLYRWHRRLYDRYRIRYLQTVLWVALWLCRCYSRLRHAVSRLWLHLNGWLWKLDLHRRWNGILWLSAYWNSDSRRRS